MVVTSELSSPEEPNKLFINSGWYIQIYYEALVVEQDFEFRKELTRGKYENMAEVIDVRHMCFCFGTRVVGTPVNFLIFNNRILG